MGKKIKVGVDIRDLRIAKTGARTYLEELCHEFRITDPAFDFVFIDTSIPVYTGKNKLLKLIEHVRFLVWKQVSLPFKAWVKGCDIVFCTDFFVPLWQPGFVTIPVFHDAFFWEYPSHYNKYWLKAFFTLGVSAAKKSPFIVTCSQYAKQQISKLAGIDATKLIVIYEAPKTAPAPAKNEHAAIRHNIWDLDQADFILHVGTLEKRKNLQVLVAAFELLLATHPSLKLVLIGQASNKKYLDDSTDLHKMIAARNLTDKVIFTGYVTDEELAFFYQKAKLYAFPSRNEGFGIPVLEAFSYELPVVVADNTCLPEVAGNAALSFDPDDIGELHNKMNTLLNDTQLRDQLKEKMKERLELFSWKKTAAELKDLFRQSVR